MAEGRRVLNPNGIGVVVFAHKSTAGWEAQLQAMVDAGWIMTGSWPIDTEMGSRLRAQDSAALASSIHLVCRPRPEGEQSIGDWREVLAELPIRIHQWLPRLADEGVVGADAIFACLGPALEVFSRFSRVEKASGEQVTLKEYLLSVWAAVSREALGMIFSGADSAGFEEDARLTAMWLWTLATGNGGFRALMKMMKPKLRLMMNQRARPSGHQAILWNTMPHERSPKVLALTWKSWAAWWRSRERRPSFLL